MKKSIFRLLVLGALLSDISCQSTKVPIQTPTPKPEPTAAPAPEAADEIKIRKIGDNSYAEPNAKGLITDAVAQAALCPPENNCRIEETFDAGKAPNGHTLTIVGIRSTKKMPAEETLNGACPDEPLWLLETDATGQVVRKEFVMTAFKDNVECNYGVSGGDESVSFDKGKLVYNVSGGSSWKWSTTAVYQLFPQVRQFEEVNLGFWGFGEESNTFESKQDFINDYRRVKWSSPNCAIDEASDVSENNFSYDKIPQLEPHDSFLQNWKMVEAQPAKWLKVDSTGSLGDRQGGYLIHGEAGSKSDPAFWIAFADEKTIFIEVTDAVLVTNSHSWVTDDHLEIWASEKDLPGYMDRCLSINDGKKFSAEKLKEMQESDRYVEPPLQWGVRLSDAKVFSGFGNPKVNPHIERVVLSDGKSKVYRFKVSLPFKPGALTVVYSDSDGGKKQKRLLSTSQLKYGNGASLGEGWESKE